MLGNCGPHPPLYFRVLSLSPDRLTTSHACCAFVHPSGFVPPYFGRHSRLPQPSALASPTPSAFSLAPASRPLTSSSVSLATTFALGRCTSFIARYRSFGIAAFQELPSYHLLDHPGPAIYTIVINDNLCVLCRWNGVPPFIGL